MKAIVLSLVVMGAVLGSDAADVVIRDGQKEWHFLEVNGKSLLPLEYMRTGKNMKAREEVTMPRFWIGEKMVSEDDFAALMGRRVHEKREGKAAVTEIEWEEAFEYAEKFTSKYQAQFPTNTYASLPHMLEWAHAARVLDGKVDLCSEAGAYLFTSTGDGGYLHTLGGGMMKSMEGATNKSEVVAWDFCKSFKRVKSDEVGIRLVLVDVGASSDGESMTMVRGSVLLNSGNFAAGKRYYELACKKGKVSERERERAKKILGMEEPPYHLEDWSGLVALAAKSAAEKGYQVEPFCCAWQWRGVQEMEDEKVTRAYKQKGIVGEWKLIGELSREIQKDQTVGEEYTILNFEEEDGEGIEIKIGTNTMVQVLTCDFTGDGRADKVVEIYGSVGSLGYWYNFYQQLENGSYTNVYQVQTVGMCVLPKKDGKGCGFITVSKDSNPILVSGLLEFKKGGMKYTSLYEDRPFYMIDTQDNRIYMAAPFIGAGYGLGWRILESRGIWYRPFFWPWKAGTVLKK